MVIAGAVVVVWRLATRKTKWARARADWRATKDAVPKLRKAKWSLWRATGLAGFVATAFFAFVVWVGASAAAATDQ